MVSATGSDGRLRVVVDLEAGAGRYRRLVLGVEDADGALARIEWARREA